MNDLISREAAIQAINKFLLEPDSVAQQVYSSDVIDAINKCPVIEAISIDLVSKWLAVIYNPPTRKAAGLTETEKTKAWKSFLTEIASSYNEV